MLNPKYLNKPLGSLSALASCLSFKLNNLTYIAENIKGYYLSSRVIGLKSDGTPRTVVDVLPQLKILHQKIKENIFYNVEYPMYLYNLRTNGNHKRNHQTNATLHCNKRMIQKEDIKSFFPSIHRSEVKKLWKYFFNFPDEVAEILTVLTTHNDRVPEGRSTSSFIAHLIFWDTEPKLVEWLHQKGFTYTRFVDDISISSNRIPDKKEMHEITTKIYSMFLQKGIKPNRKKRAIQFRNTSMSVNKLNLNSGSPTLGKKKWSILRSEVKQFEDWVMNQTTFTDDYHQKYSIILGKVTYAASIQPTKAKPYMERVRKFRPDDK